LPRQHTEFSPGRVTVDDYRGYPHRFVFYLNEQDNKNLKCWCTSIGLRDVHARNHENENYI